MLVVTSGEEVFAAQNEATAVHVLCKGDVVYHKKRDIRSMTRSLSRFSLNAADATGVPCAIGTWLSSIACFLVWRHIGTANMDAERICEVLRLPIKDFLGVLQQHPNLHMFSHDYGLKIVQHLQTAIDERDIDDIVGPEFGTVLSQMDRELRVLVSHVALKSCPALKIRGGMEVLL